MVSVASVVGIGVHAHVFEHLLYNFVVERCVIL